MAEKVKLSKDGHSIDFVQTENIPTSMKKFRQSPEIEGFYRFIYENDLQKEAFEILEKIVNQRKLAKKALKQEAAQTKKLEQIQTKEQKQSKNEIEKNKVTVKPSVGNLPKKAKPKIEIAKKSKIVIAPSKTSVKAKNQSKKTASKSKKK